MPKVHALYMMSCKEGEPERERERGGRGGHTQSRTCIADFIHVTIFNIATSAHIEHA